MGALWPDSAAPPARCANCHRPVSPGNLIAGKYGTDCAERLGLTVHTPRLRTEPQTGPDLFDNEGEPDGDFCDGYDR